MSSQKSNQSLSDVYRTAWESCVALWPVFFVRLVFVILNIGAFVLCLFLACWPLIQGLINSYRNSSSSTFQKFIQSFKPADFSQFMPDAQGILLAIGLGILFVIWWLILGAWFNGGLLARFSDYQKNGTPFSLVEFIKDGLRFLLPMIGLLILWFVIYIVSCVAGCLLFVMASILLKALSIPWWVGLCMAVPGGVVGLVLFMGLVVFGVLATAYLVDGKGIFKALGRAGQKCFEDYGRVVWAFLLFWAFYFIFAIAFKVVATIFSSLPYVGFLFSIADFLFSIFLSVAISVYMSALAVTFSLEKEN